MADDLRDQIAEALVGHALTSHGLHERPPYIDPHTERIVRENSASRADAVLSVVGPELERLRAELAAFRTDETDVDWLADHVRTAVHYVLGRIEPRLDGKVRTEAAEQASIHIRAGSVPFVNARVMDLAIDLIKQAEAERDALKADLKEAEFLAGSARADHAGAERRLTVAQRNIEIKDQAITEHLAAIERVRRMAQVWVDIRPDYPTATREGHAAAWCGEQILAALDTPTPTEEAR